jgi:hypothetical protein
LPESRWIAQLESPTAAPSEIAHAAASLVASDHLQWARCDPGRFIGFFQQQPQHGMPELEHNAIAEIPIATPIEQRSIACHGEIDPSRSNARNRLRLEMHGRR